MKDEDLQELLIFLERSKLRIQVLEALSTGTVIASFLAKKLHKHRETISRVLKDLLKQELAECVNPDQPHFRKYQITRKGKEVLAYRKQFLK